MSQSAPLSSLTENAESVFAVCLAKVREKMPDLAAVIDAWATLPDALKAGILAMVRTQTESKQV